MCVYIYVHICTYVFESLHLRRRPSWASRVDGRYNIIGLLRLRLHRLAQGLYRVDSRCRWSIISSTSFAWWNFTKYYSQNKLKSLHATYNVTAWLTAWLVERCWDHGDIFIGDFRGDVVNWLHRVSAWTGSVDWCNRFCKFAGMFSKFWCSLETMHWDVMVGVC